MYRSKNTSLTLSCSPVHVMTRKFLGEMTRKLSVTESQKCAQLRGTCSPRKSTVVAIRRQQDDLVKRRSIMWFIARRMKAATVLARRSKFACQSAISTNHASVRQDDELEEVGALDDLPGCSFSDTKPLVAATCEEACGQ